TTNARIGVQQFIRQIRQLRQKLNVPATFSDYALPKEEVQAAIPKIAEGRLMDGCTKTNPVQPTTEEVTKIVNYIL
ncbi:alcohol dehydrogenase, partial [Enterococcus faecalis]